MTINSIFLQSSSVDFDSLNSLVKNPLSALSDLESKISAWIKSEACGLTTSLPGNMIFCQQWNVRTLIMRGSDFYFFAKLYCSCLGINALLALTTEEGSNKGI